MKIDFLKLEREIKIIQLESEYYDCLIIEKELLYYYNIQKFNYLNLLDKYIKTYDNYYHVNL